MTPYSRLILLLFLFIHPPLFAQNDFKWVTVKNGEAFNSFLIRNRLSSKDQIEQFKILNKDRFNKYGQLIAGRKYKVPSIYTDRKISLFGEKYAEVNQVDNSLAGTVLYLVAGHGGPDPGAVGKTSGKKITEDEYAYDIILRLGKELITHGAKVHFIIKDPNDGIRDEAYLKPDYDEICYPSQKIPSQHTPRLNQRAAAVNILARRESKSAYQRLIMIHLDSGSKSDRTDVYFYHNATSTKGKKFAYTLQNKMKEKYLQNQPNREYTGTVSTRRLYMLQTTTPPSVFIELGNINNSRDQKRFLIYENRQALAEWLCEGIIDDYKQEKIK